jgi:hypothetical protein
MMVLRAELMRTSFSGLLAIPVMQMMMDSA